MLSNIHFQSSCVIAIDIPFSCKWIDFFGIIYASLGVSDCERDIRISYVFQACPPPVIINDDSSLMFYLQIKSIQSDFNKLPLCVEFVQPFQGCTESVPNTVNYSILDDEVLDVLEDSELLASADEQTMHSSDVFCPSSSIEYSDLGPLSFDEDVNNDDLTSSFEVPFISFVPHFDPTHLDLDAIYKNKKEFSFNLKVYAITNFFQY
ncbi:unnamed protein product [Cuscuta europaea]|uniref:Uncharacterized protein n=1 Tax=Cuscuta europaea TaxID=41803 RepID=A0A9P0ZHM4_CUSEU|nr:unnamed protein product [Cuscuta europaea]